MIGFRINALVAETGDADYLGKGVKAGFHLAMEEINRICSNSGCPKIQIRYYDTGSLPGTALMQFKNLYAKGERVFVGLVTSDEASAVAQYASKHAPDAIIVSPSSTATELCQYKQLYRLSMDDRGYAAVLRDITNELKKKFHADKIFIKVVYSDNVHGRGLHQDIKNSFMKAEKNTYDISSFPYSKGSQLDANQLVSQLNSSFNNIAAEKVGLIVLVGLKEAELILQEATKYDFLKGTPWVLSDTLAFSNIKIPDSLDVYGLNFRGTETDSKQIKRELFTIKRLLNEHQLPPMAQPLLAYDAISLVQKLYEYSRTKSKSIMASEGITGDFDFSSCHDRSSGEYTFAKHKGKDTKLINVEANMWIKLAHYEAHASESSSTNMYADVEDISILTMEDSYEKNVQQTEKVDLTVASTPAVSITKTEILQFLEGYIGEKCEHTAHFSVTSTDDNTQVQRTSSFTVATLPEIISVHAQYGFILKGSCQTEKESIEIVKICPGAKLAGSEVTCNVRTTRKPVGDFEFFSSYSASATSTTTVSGSSCNMQGAIIVNFGSINCRGHTVTPPAARSSVRRGKYICTELFRQGYMSPELMLSDMNFAQEYVEKHPIIRNGYDVIGPLMASLMESSKTVTEIAKHLVIPWAEEMAYQGGYRNQGNEFGAWAMSVGSAICAMVGAAFTIWGAIGNNYKFVHCVTVCSLRCCCLWCINWCFCSKEHCST